MMIIVHHWRLVKLGNMLTGATVRIRNGIMLERLFAVLLLFARFSMVQSMSHGRHAQIYYYVNCLFDRHWPHKLITIADDWMSVNWCQLPRIKMQFHQTLPMKCAAKTLKCLFSSPFQRATLSETKHTNQYHNTTVIITHRTLVCSIKTVNKQQQQQQTHWPCTVCCGKNCLIYSRQSRANSSSIEICLFSFVRLF